jgi:hypothetical protein
MMQDPIQTQARATLEFICGGDLVDVGWARRLATVSRFLFARFSPRGL